MHGSPLEGKFQLSAGNVRVSQTIILCLSHPGVFFFLESTASELLDVAMSFRAEMIALPQQRRVWFVGPFTANMTGFVLNVAP